ncbi:hypothetical protein [Chromobacterium haemolyticum]|uniref:hypothetical protein n=1 Tax=Chromobacterium haemolyticum TaxID=394935 RepID=UPI00131659C5|nr:hypothetical protein [Chromobacterium haemolyticum]BBH12917.1 hypothetical protein CH06BL_21650 [Chromobacterium haemolyticum]
MSNVEKTSVVAVVVSIFLLILMIAWMTATSSTRVAKTILKSTLFDIDSAKFENVYWNDGRDHICGSVNAKNKMGAYVGVQRFVLPYWSVAERDFDLYARLTKFENDDQVEFISEWNKWCDK